MTQQHAPVLCSECGEDIERCDECQHPHDWYDHVLVDHMCRWCLLSDYGHDPLGLRPHVVLQNDE